MHAGPSSPPQENPPLQSPAHPLLRVRDGHEAKVTYTELFFDLVYVFAVTQVSHFLLGNLSVLGAVQTLLLWFAVWLGWQYTCWMTNWFNPDTRPIRLLLFGLMLMGLLMAAALPEAFASRGLIFAGAYATLQVGRALFIRLQLDRGHPLSANFNRILGWACLSAVFWLAGGLADGATRLWLWTIAVACEYFAPMFGFPLPWLGRSDSRGEWTIEGGHLVERCGLFMIVALGESILVTGATLGHAEHWEGQVLLGFLVSFFGSLAMWWLYFNIAVKDATEVIVYSQDPGRLGAYFHYVHVIILAGVIVTAVGNDLVIAHPHGHMALKYLLVLIGGPLLFLLGNGLYKRAVYGAFPRSHVAGVALLLLATALAPRLDLLMLNALSTVLLAVVGAMETLARRVPPVQGGHTAAH